MAKSVPDLQTCLSDWLSYIEELHPKLMELGLERIKEAVELLKLTQPAPFIFTVAGTNGKGTTCRALEIFLLNSGYRVGVFSSPHILHYVERVRINGKNLSEFDHVQSFDFIEKNRKNLILTYFEFGFLSALNLFKNHLLDVVILEVGLGGRLDATNIIDANVSVLTSVDFDHIKWLGDSLDLIGAEKAEICRKNRPFIIGEPNCPNAVFQVAKQKEALIFSVKPNKNSSWDFDEHEKNWDFSFQENTLLSLPKPKIPLQNAATALAAIYSSKLNVSEKIIRSSLEKINLWGRFQILQKNPMIICDAAHNPHAAHYLSKKLEEYKTSTNKIIAIIGMMIDKNIEKTINEMKNVVDFWYPVSLNYQTNRGATSEQISQFIKNKEFMKITLNFSQALNLAKQSANKKDVIIIFGSFYLVAEAFKVFNVTDNEFYE